MTWTLREDGYLECEGWKNPNVELPAINSTGTYSDRVLVCIDGAVLVARLQVYQTDREANPLREWAVIGSRSHWHYAVEAAYAWMHFPPAPKVRP